MLRGRKVPAESLAILVNEASLTNCTISANVAAGYGAGLDGLDGLGTSSTGQRVSAAP